MADVNITFTIPEAHVDKIRTGFLHLYPVPLDGEGAPTMTDLAWVRERIRFWVVTQARNGLEKKARDEAETTVIEDGDIQ